MKLEDAGLADVLRQGLLVVEGERALARRFETLFDFEGGSGSFTGVEATRAADASTRSARWEHVGAEVTQSRIHQNGRHRGAGAETPT